jgi:type I restriction enzyme, S subunit
MGVITKVKFSEIAKSHYMFLTFNFFKLRKLIDEDLPFLQIRLADYFGIISGFAFSSKDYMDEGISVCRIGDISKYNELLFEEMLKLPEEYEDDHSKYLVQNNDLLIGMTGDGKFFKTCFVENLDEPILLNQRVGIIRVKENITNISPKFISLLFNSDKVQNQIRIVAMGKTQKNVSPFDILNVRIPKLDYDIQIELLKIIQPVEIEITNLKNSKLKPLNIINQIFGEELGFDWDKFERLKKQKTYSSNLKEFSNNIDCRMGLKFHNLAGKYLQSFLISKTAKKVKDFINEPIVLGKSVSPSDYDDDGDYYYIAMSNIKTYAFDPEDCKKVSEEYAKSNLKKTVQKGDILLARSGEGTIGKVALIEDEEMNAIFADFTQRIRLTNYNKLFAYYYFRSEFFQYLVYTHKKGLGNNTNIFPSQIQEFPIPDWDETKQTQIVEKIKNQIDAQNLIDQQIEAKQQQINEIIENAIKSE